jgi:16S rRNA (guanine966-N2)-methyltransferase
MADCKYRVIGYLAYSIHNYYEMRKMAGTLRITGGRLSRRRFMVPKAADLGLTRPTGDMVRAAIFSSLGSFVVDSQVLDLFSGSGAYGFEAISRGAASVLFLEKAHEPAKCIEKNAQNLAIKDQCQVLIKDAVHFAQSSSLKTYELIFVDPPYNLVLEPAFWTNLMFVLHRDSVVVFRCRSKKDFACPLEYQIIREKSYGGTMTFFLILRP